jgi:hypothetical protein
MGKELIDGLMAESTLAHGRMANSMGKEFLYLLKEAATSVLGKKTRCTVSLPTRREELQGERYGEKMS